MSILVWIIFGGLVGWVASIITGTNSSQGLIGNIVVGILGALLGGFIMSMLGGPGVNSFNIYDFLVALGGAVVLLFVLRSLTHHRE